MAGGATLSPEALRKVHALPTRSINRAIVYRYVGENASLPVARPKGTEDNLRESRSFSVEELADSSLPAPAFQMDGTVRSDGNLCAIDGQGAVS